MKRGKITPNPLGLIGLLFISNWRQCKQMEEAYFLCRPAEEKPRIIAQSIGIYGWISLKASTEQTYLYCVSAMELNKNISYCLAVSWFAHLLGFAQLLFDVAGLTSCMVTRKYLSKDKTSKADKTKFCDQETNLWNVRCILWTCMPLNDRTTYLRGRRLNSGWYEPMRTSVYSHTMMKEKQIHL